MPEITETIKKGQIKRKTGENTVDILRPETEADIVLYSKTIEGTAVTNVKDALDKIVTGIGVTGVKGQAENSYRSGNVNIDPQNIGVSIGSSGSTTSGQETITVGASADGTTSKTLAVVTKDTNQTVSGIKTFTSEIIAKDQVRFSDSDTGAMVIKKDGNTNNLKIQAAIGKVDINNAIHAYGIASLPLNTPQIQFNDTYVSSDSTSLLSKYIFPTSTKGATSGTTPTYTIATTDDITSAINALDTQSNVAPAVVSGSSSSQKITFKDINETNGIIAAGSNITSAVTYTDGAIDALLDTKINKRTSGNEVYTHSGTTQGGIVYDTAATGSYIVQRDSNGQVIVPETPTANSHAASKKYVDNKITQGAEYLGIVDDTTELYALDSSAGEGDWVRVGTQFTYSSETCHVGDILICSAEKGSSTHATWDVIHTEVDTDTNTQYQAIVGASGTGYAGSIKLQSKEIGGSFADQDTIKFINGSSGKISITPDTINKTLTIEHAIGSTASQASGFYKFSTDSTSHINSVTAVAKADLTGLGVADDDLVVHKGSYSNPSNEDIYGIKTFKEYSNGEFDVSPSIKFEGATGSIINQGGNIEISGQFAKALIGYSVDLTAAVIPAQSNEILIRAPGETCPSDWEAGISFITTDTKYNDSTSQYEYRKGYAKLPTNDGSSSSNYYTLATTHDLTGFVTGPSSSTDNAIAVYDGTTGKVIKNSSLIVSDSVINGSMGYVDLSSSLRFGLKNANASVSLDPSVDAAFIADGTGIKNLGSNNSKWQDLYLSRNLTDGTNSTTIANIVAGLTTNVNSGKKSDGTTDITGSKSGTVITLGNSGITAGTYSAIQVNAKGIAIAGGQILDVIAHGGTPNVVTGGWYFEEVASA